MPDPFATLAAVRSSTAGLLTGLDEQRWSDTDVRAPSLLPNWSRGHVLTHLARNADAIAGAIASALRGDPIPMYPHGREGRNADIEAGAGRSSAELTGDVREAADRLDRVLGALADADGWELPAHGRTAGEYVKMRWREVEIHRVDLAGSYQPAAWSSSFVADLLPVVAAGLAARSGSRALRVQVTAAGSVASELVGSSWEAGDGEPTVVSGPDWAVLAWLLGRTAPAASQLSATPELAPWL